jgi:hypothetical protein
MSLPPEADYSFDLEQYRVDAAQCDAAAFAAKHGHAFLVLSRASGGGLRLADGPRQTMAVESIEAAEAWLPGDLRVWPIRKSERSLIARFVSVGRTRRNDVVVPDVSLSKFHAFFTEEHGVFAVQDARSRNGTFVEGKRVAPQGEGAPTPLRSGARVKFGTVELTFVDAQGLHRLVRQFRRP